MKHWNYLNVWSLKSPFLNITSYRFRNAFPVWRVTRNTENYLWTLTKPGLSVSPSCFQSSSVPSSRSASFCFLRLLLLQHLCPGLGWTAVSHSHLLNLLSPLALSPFSFHPGRVRTRRQSSGSVGGASSSSVVDSRGRSRAKVVSQSQRMYRHLMHVLKQWC